MRSFTVCCLLAALAVVHCRPEQSYTNKFDNIDIKEILKNRRLLVPYLKCTLGKGICSPEGKELKSHIQEALETNCAKCSPKQRESANIVIKHLINHEPNYWNELINKYDPQRKYVTKYEADLKDILS